MNFGSTGRGVEGLYKRVGAARARRHEAAPRGPSRSTPHGAALGPGVTAEVRAGSTHRPGTGTWKLVQRQGERAPPHVPESYNKKAEEVNSLHPERWPHADAEGLVKRRCLGTTRTRVLDSQELTETSSEVASRCPRGLRWVIGPATHAASRSCRSNSG